MKNRTKTLIGNFLLLIANCIVLTLLYWNLAEERDKALVEDIILLVGLLWCITLVRHFENRLLPQRWRSKPPVRTYRKRTKQKAYTPNLTTQNRWDIDQLSGS